MTLNPRKSPAVFSALWACCALLLCGNLEIWGASPDRWANTAFQLPASQPGPPPASGGWSNLFPAGTRYGTLGFLVHRGYFEAQEVRVGYRRAEVVFWPYRYSLATALLVFALGGGLGRFAYWRLWEHGTDTRGAT